MLDLSWARVSVRRVWKRAGPYTLLLETLLKIILVDVGLLVPRVLLSGRVDLGELLLGRASLVGGLLGGIGGDITEEDGCVTHCGILDANLIGGQARRLTNFAELAVGDQQGSKSLETLQSLVSILLAIILADGEAGPLRITGGDVLGLPDEVLQQLALILGQEELLGLVNDIAQVLDENLAVARELLRRRGEGLGRQSTIQGNVALLVLWETRHWVSTVGLRQGHWSEMPLTEGSLLFLKASGTISEVRENCGRKGKHTMVDSKQLELGVDILRVA